MNIIALIVSKIFGKAVQPQPQPVEVAQEPELLKGLFGEFRKEAIRFLAAEEAEKAKQIRLDAELAVQIKVIEEELNRAPQNDSVQYELAKRRARTAVDEARASRASSWKSLLQECSREWWDLKGSLLQKQWEHVRGCGEVISCSVEGESMGWSNNPPQFEVSERAVVRYSGQLYLITTTHYVRGSGFEISENTGLTRVWGTSSPAQFRTAELETATEGATATLITWDEVAGALRSAPAKEIHPRDTSPSMREEDEVEEKVGPFVVQFVRSRRAGKKVAQHFWESENDPSATWRIKGARMAK